MSHYTVKFDAESQEANDEMAIAEIKSYLGADEFKKCHQVFLDQGDELNHSVVRFTCGMFLGIKGYPVEAWWRLLEKERNENMKI